AAGDPWSAKQAKILGTKSPTALKLTLACLRKGADLSFEDVMRQDLRVSSWCLTGTDFYEGVRAVIIDKDQAPKWAPAAADSEIEKAFAPLDAAHEMSFLDEA
ncbi:MAG: enoyl-CoA hydratase, partial [Maricaulis maris]